MRRRHKTAERLVAVLDDMMSDGERERNFIRRLMDQAQSDDWTDDAFKAVAAFLFKAAESTNAEESERNS